MSESPGAAVHINRPTSSAYVVRVRLFGHRKWRLLPGAHKRHAVAAQRAARLLVEGRYKCAQVLLTAEYYEPSVVLDMVRR